MHGEINTTKNETGGETKSGTPNEVFDISVPSGSSQVKPEPHGLVSLHGFVVGTQQWKQNRATRRERIATRQVEVRSSQEPTWSGHKSEASHNLGEAGDIPVL